MKFKFKKGELIKIKSFATGFKKKFKEVDYIQQEFIYSDISNTKGIILDKYNVLYKRHTVLPKYVKEYTVYVNHRFVFNIPESSLEKLNV